MLRKVTEKLQDNYWDKNHIPNFVREALSKCDQDEFEVTIVVKKNYDDWDCMATVSYGSE